ncbi:hypothetical protein HELRODRAFT_84879 [Helobdella robusta]|uniref:Secreted protein n=1 Tax=Helobdella robusta TaxID=6412 RepID=T1G5Q0_HELRO|nr:hypothetical protein HELRODRAFT_84879 [Helobdella robusta]ESN98086.1 hypothetical protein HELRODRAFT_84879 [Helobdella robusta]
MFLLLLCYCFLNVDVLTEEFVGLVNIISFDFRCSDYSDFRCFGYSDFRCFGCSDFRCFGYSDFRCFEYSDFRYSGYSDCFGCYSD